MDLKGFFFFLKYGCLFARSNYWMNQIKNEEQIGLSAVTIENDTLCDLQMVSLFYFTFPREH